MWQIQIDWELLVQCLEAFLSFLLFPKLCRTRSIHFVLLNYLIRTHPSRWASWSLINLIPAFIHPALSDRVVLSFHFPFPRDRFLHPSAVSLISFFLSYTSTTVHGKSERVSRSSIPSILEGARERTFRTISGYHFA